MLSIRLLGTPKIMYEQHPVTVTRRKSRAFLYYLAAHPTPLAREQLQALFWPDLDRQAARRNLRVTLHGLRKILGSLLVVDSDTLALADQAKVDTRIFKARLSSSISDLGLLKETLDLYQGDFISGFTLPNLIEFDDWVMLEREHYRRLAVKGLTTLSQLYEAQQDFRAALETLERALAFDQLQEDLQRISLRIHYLAGDRAGAIRRYEKFRALLADEMGVPPMAETRALYDAIITDTLAAGTPSPAAAAPKKPPQAETPFPFVGRKTELQKLDDLVASRKLVLIEGEAGIGKSRLIEQFIQTKQKLERSAFLALIGQAHELESMLPYQPLIEALRGVLTHPDWPALRLKLKLPRVWQTEVARLLPELVSDPHAQLTVSQTRDEIRLWEGVSQFLLALARQIPLVLALDDLHWADPSTLSLLGYLIRKAGQDAAAIVFVAATRQIPPGSPLMILQETLLREDRLKRLPLERLTSADVTLWAKHSSPTYALPLTDWRSKDQKGIPLS